MSEIDSDLREAFETAGYDVANVSVNRDAVRVALVDDDAPAEDLREITREAVGGDAVRGLDVSPEAIDGRERMGTVVSFRHRP
jgi:hypothetical protein